MGNCQAAEAATVMIQNPSNNKIHRIYSSVTAHEIMNSNPGNYVALIVASRSHNGPLFKHLKLLRPDDYLLLGHVYRLVSFEDVLKEFASKKCVKLGKKLKERRGIASSNPNVPKSEKEAQLVGDNNCANSSTGIPYGGHWKPALQSISET